MKKSFFIVTLAMFALFLIVPSVHAASSVVVSKIDSSWPWYLTRASGLIAAVLMVILILSGIGSVTGHTFRFLEPIVAWATHRALGIAFTVAVLVHVGSLLFDKFQPFSITIVLVPFTTNYHPFDVALGILAFWSLLIVMFTSRRSVINKRPRFWRITHFLSYAVLILVFFHALSVGTDLASGWLRELWILAGGLLVLAIVIRLWRAGTLSGTNDGQAKKP